MSILFFDGFEYLGNAAASLLKYDYVVSPDYLSTSGRDGGGCVRFYGAADYCLKYLTGNTSDTIIVGTAIKTESGGNARAIAFYADGVQHVDLRYGSNVSGAFSVYVNSVLLASSDLNTLPYGNWGYVEIKIVFHHTTGSVEVRFNGETVISESNIDTMVASEDAFCDQLRFGRVDTMYNYMYFDDLYVCNGAGTSNNDFLGDIKVAPLYATSDGSVTDFTPLSGVDHYLMVDDPQLTDGSTYVESGTVGHKELFGMQSAPTSEEIYGLQLTVASIKQSGGTVVSRALMKSGTTPTETEGNSIYAATFLKGETLLFEKEPIDTVVWTPTIIGATEFGVKVHSLS